jgi:hypothetical protein
MRNRASSGQASVSLIATIPLLLLVALALAQAALAEFGAWSAANAARAAARASYAGLDPRSAARAALPGPLADGAEVDVGADRARVEVGVPRLLPVPEPIAVSASAHLAPADGLDDGG